MSALDIASSLIKQFEGCRLEAYVCPAGKDTIGYGHTGPDVAPGLAISQDQADDLLTQDLAKFSNSVKSLVTVPLTDNQLGALVSFTYNVGTGNLKESTLLRRVNEANHSDAAQEFKRWVYCKGEVLPGLVTRRDAESAVYATLQSTPQSPTT